MRGGEIKRIIIVEDDLSTKPLWLQILAGINCDIHWAVSSEEALKMIENLIFERKSIALIITDIFLAGSGTGLELISSQLVRAANIKLVINSAVDCEELKNQFGEMLDGVLVLKKPIDIKSARAQLMEILNV